MIEKFGGRDSSGAVISKVIDTIKSDKYDNWRSDKSRFMLDEILE